MTYPARLEVGQESDAAGSNWQLYRGARVTPFGTTFSVWAPAATSLSVHIATGDAAGDYALGLAEGQRGVWEVAVPGVKAGDRYGFVVDGADPLPDPVSRAQPDGVHGLSEVVDPDAFVWTDDQWHGVAMQDVVIYEIHVGTFTPEGTFEAAAARLPELLSLGVTAIEIMPVSSFPGRRNWGYDGVHLYAPQHSYGGPQGLKRLVNAAHAHGIGVVLDVVYNHVGPEGNYLDRFGPYFTDVYRTPWGRAVNYDGPGSDAVRRWAHDNALYWVSEFHVDALRLDAVHGIFDFGSLSFLEEISDEIHEIGRYLGRKVQLMAESDLNDPKLVRPPEKGGFGLDAQWADDVHHTIHAALTGESHGYYRDYHGIATVADVYREPFFYARRYNAHRDRTHGRSSAGIPRQRFIVAAQNHDQVGNRPNGERLATLVGPDRQRLAAALVLLSPYVPLLFMGEEYGETAPFLYFIEHSDPDLIEAVRTGRKREFEALGKSEAQIDPQAEETFLRSRLDWSKRDTDAGARLMTLYCDLLALRRDEPALKPGDSETHVQGAAEWFTALRVLPLRNDMYDAVRSRRALFCVFNLSGETLNIPVRPEAIGSWKLRLSTDAVGYGGGGAMIEDIPAERTAAASDAPKRLLERRDPLVDQLRGVRMPAWTAAVFERDFLSDGARG
ncbi:MAG: malto-oligosyltrehalose trehalohydrolase [Gemmatimonadetes bacterium]|nr:malto-oligosyltrehalose trehalohydrolase [Gemmatimonadota bacterium]